MRLVLTLLFASAVSLSAQTVPTSRVEEIELAREAKAETIKPEESPAESKINQLMSGNFVQKVLIGGEGFSPRLGGLPTGQGFALGVGYRDTTLLGGALRFESSIAGSASRAWVADLGVSSPDLLDRRVFVDAYAKHSNYPRFEYFGSGPDSSTENGTTFRIEETSADLAVKHGFAERRDYSVAWGVFDNDRETTTAIDGATGLGLPTQAKSPGYYVATITANDPAKTVVVYLRTGARRSEIVGIERTW